ncbi:Hypothetical protein PHPALM_6782 [Phytophthora palmivora]|uniref:Uncharacterized protein n=1 Tax=Phytophthora palmivora TaxID=4796 RepID=A0A2P4YE00_9STRA|nr:Hypothetical protein PHPALM_6782 [Phytophthora palmivora]
MAASGADNMQTEPSTDDAPQPPYQASTETPAILDAVEEKRAPSRRAQRVRTVRLTTQVHPDMLVPYLYGENGGRCINTIVNATGCTIDYCALSPDEPERSPQSHAYVMNFLVSAGSIETLEEATRQLRKLVERVQVYLQKKVRARGREEMDDRRLYEASRGRRGVSPRLSAAPSEAAKASKREAIPDERWNSEDEAWDAPPIQRVYYAPSRIRRERPRYMGVTGEADEKNEFVLDQGRLELIRCIYNREVNHRVTSSHAAECDDIQIRRGGCREVTQVMEKLGMPCIQSRHHKEVSNSLSGFALGNHTIFIKGHRIVFPEVLSLMTPMACMTQNFLSMLRQLTSQMRIQAQVNYHSLLTFRDSTYRCIVHILDEAINDH